MQTQAYIPSILKKNGDSVEANLVAFFLGVGLMGLVAQITFRLPFTPVPITGQTFGVTLIALIWGRKRALTVIAAYLLLGFVGVPLFAAGQSGLLIGPTLGYLIGMFFAAAVMGELSDRGWTQKFLSAWGAALLGSVIIFSFGVFGLSFFIPKAQLVMAGVIPFLLGDILKTLIASQIASAINRKT